MSPDALGLQRFGGECRDRDRHVLDVLLALLRRDDHFLQLLRKGCGAENRNASSQNRAGAQVAAARVAPSFSH